MDMHMQPRRDDVFAVTLEAQQWNSVLTVLGKGPYELVAPLIAEIQQQCQAQQHQQMMARRPPEMPMLPPDGYGAAPPLDSVEARGGENG